MAITAPIFRKLIESGRNQAAGMDPIGRFGRYAKEAQDAAFRDALEQGSTDWGNQLIGTPGVLAASSMGSSPGGLARMRSRSQRQAIGNIARGFTGVAADTARSKRDFAGGILSMREQARLEKEAKKKKKKGLLSTLGSIAGTGLGMLTNPVGTVTGAISSLAGGGGNYGSDEYDTGYHYGG